MVELVAHFPTILGVMPKHLLVVQGHPFCVISIKNPHKIACANKQWNPWIVKSDLLNCQLSPKEK